MRGAVSKRKEIASLMCPVISLALGLLACSATGLSLPATTPSSDLTKVFTIIEQGGPSYCVTGRAVDLSKDVFLADVPGFLRAHAVRCEGTTAAQ